MAAAAFTCAPANDVTACAALGDLYAATNGAGMASNSGWSSAAAGTATDYRSFQGVICAAVAVLTWRICVGGTASSQQPECSGHCEPVPAALLLPGQHDGASVRAAPCLLNVPFLRLCTHITPVAARRGVGYLAFPLCAVGADDTCSE